MGMIGARMRDAPLSPRIGTVECRGLPELVGGGYGEWTRLRPHELGDHDHPGHWELHYLVRGQIVETVAGVPRVMNAGDVLVAPPGLRHSGIHHVRHRCGVFWLGLRIAPLRPLPGMTRERTAGILRSLRASASVPFPGDPWLLPAFTGLMRDSALPDGVTRTVACRAWLHAILALVARPASAAPAARSPAVERAIARLSQRLDRPLGMAELSAAAGLGRSALHDRFVAEVGLTPAELRMSLRLEEAKRMLTTASNAEVARRLGFASAQHFITAFRRAYRITPGAWRAAPR